MTWEMVDEGWGNAAPVWAYTNEPRFRPEYDAVLSALDLGAGDRYLDIACGSGFASQLASERGAEVSGIDASHRLLSIAAARTPAGDFRVGDMHDLPWDDDTFASATSFRGIWGNTPAAVIEAARVLRPGGRLGLSFWPTDLLEAPTAEIWMALAPASRHERSHMAGMASIGADGRAEEMCVAAGLEPGPRTRVDFVVESPDADAEIRAALASGPAYTAVGERGLDDVSAALRSALEPFTTAELGVRVPQSIEFVVATKPG
ncbi:MAG: class I SAM-dependent methyltransferase [Actinomycetota bacterium]